MSLRPEHLGICAVVGAVMLFSVQDMTFKLLSDHYALHQIVFIRGIVAIGLTIGALIIFTGSISKLKTHRLKAQLLRGGLLVIGNMTFFASLASLPLGNAVATFFSAPLIISVLAIVLLGERFDTTRMLLAFLGFFGVLLIIQPGATGFGFTTILPLIAACAYSGMQLMTRHLSATETSVALAFHIHIMFVASSLIIWFIAGDGRFDQFEHPSAQFLLRAWVWPSIHDWPILLGLGALNAAAGFLIGLGYVMARAGTAAPFEYVAVPMSIFWGLLIWQQVPNFWSWIGIALVLGTGVAIAVQRDKSVSPE